jgi:uncharacterized protein (TIGR00661 family)
MAKILYGVCAAGNGHLTRSSVVINHLLNRGHKVRIATFGDGIDFFSKHPRTRELVIPIVGLRAVIRDGEVKPTETVLSNVIRHAALGWVNTAVAASTFAAFSPDMVFSDFEPWSAEYARTLDLPLYCIDNNHMIVKCQLDAALTQPDASTFANLKIITEAIAPMAVHYFVLSFAKLPIIAPRSSLHSPILRSDIIERMRSSDYGSYGLAYSWAENSAALIQTLMATRWNWRFYGAKDTKGQRGNVSVRPFSEKTFIDDLASASFVVAGGGFSLMTECIALKKPMLAVPIRRQFEQATNAYYLEKSGYGMRASEITPAVLEQFVAKWSVYLENLMKTSHDGNVGLLNQIDRAIASAHRSPRLADFAAAHVRGIK